MIRIPVPPSLNNMFTNVPGRGRVRVAAYKHWIAEAGYSILAQRPKKYTGDVTVSIVIGPRQRGDLDNRIKPVLDLLTKMKIIEDDRKVVQITAEWSDFAQPGCEVEVTPA